MRIGARLRRAPTRLATGAFILNSGIGKLRGDDETAKNVHGMAAGAYPALQKLDPKLFLRGLGVAEAALGAALLLPVVPAAVAGIGLAAFSTTLLGMYWRTPGLHQPGNPLPTERGVPIAKDVWLAGIAAGMLMDSATTTAAEAKDVALDGATRAGRRASRKARRLRLNASHALH